MPGRPDRATPGPFSGSARWIWPATDQWSAARPGGNSPYPMAFFRRRFVASRGTRLTVHVSADSRYVFWCNGRRIGRGPAKGDVRHQFYETYRLDDHLVEGENILAAQVVSYAPVRPLPWESGAPGSIMTAGWMFCLSGVLCDGSGEVIEDLSTDRRWKAVLDEAYTYRHREGWGTFLGMFEDVHGERYPWGWQEVGFDDSLWQPAYEVFRAWSDEELTGFDPHVPNVLTPRTIPMLEEAERRFDGAAKGEDVSIDGVVALIRGDAPLTIPRGSRAAVTLFCDALTTGFPATITEGGSGSRIRLTYAEALSFPGEIGERHWREVKRLLAPDHKPEVGEVIGYYDEFFPGGGKEEYEPFWWRTFRYVRLEIETRDEPITITGLTHRFTAYPFEEKATFACSDASLGRMWDMSWRTARLCAHETYEDCPYYEQLQYAGDTQVQTLISYYVAGDARLARQAIRHFDWSRRFDGLTQSRYPSRMPQYIPSWSLLWVVMVRDYWMHTGDLDEVRMRLDGVAAILRWFERYENADGLLEALPHWKVVDWVKGWEPSGYPPGADGGVSALINLQYAYALTCASELAEAAGKNRRARRWRARANRITKTVDRLCWWPEERLYRDRPGGDELSELTNAWAILSDAAPTRKARQITRRLGSDPKLAAATLYGRFYVFRAFSGAGQYGKAHRLLDHWRAMMATDLTTWPEEPFLARSYCHAWSATPIYELLAEILGIKPAAPGFARVRIEPHCWDLTWAEGSVPTPHGTVTVRWQLDGNRFTVAARGPRHVPTEIVMPDGTTHEAIGGGTFSAKVSGHV